MGRRRDYKPDGKKATAGEAKPDSEARQSLAWSRVSVDGHIPATRIGHSASVVHKEKIVVFGGWDGTEMLKDVAVLRTDGGNYSWAQPAVTGECPTARAEHCAAVLDNKVFVFGGGDGKSYLNDLFMLDCGKDASIDTVRWVMIKPSGEIPKARSRHSMAVVGHTLVLFGGSDGVTWFNDVHLFNTTTQIWTKITDDGTFPKGRWGHANVSIGVEKPKLMVFGGHPAPQGNMLNDVAIFDPANKKWSDLEKSQGTPPTARAGHTATVIDKRVFVFGGGDGDRLLNDLHIFDTDSMLWTPATTVGMSPVARAGHTSSAVGSRIYVFGGGDGHRRFKDLYVLETDPNAPKQSHRAAVEAAPSQQMDWADGSMTPPREEKKVPLVAACSPLPQTLRSFSITSTSDSVHSVLSTDQPRCGRGSRGSGARGASSNPNPKPNIRHYKRAIQQYYMNQEDTPTTPRGTMGTPRRHQPPNLTGSPHLIASPYGQGPPPVHLHHPSHRSILMPNPVVGWLASLGLAKYAPKFIREEVELHDLQNLNDADLMALKIPLGPRKKIMAALSRQGQNASPPPTDHDPAILAFQTMQDVITVPANEFTRLRATMEDLTRAVATLTQKMEAQASSKP